MDFTAQYAFSNVGGNDLVLFGAVNNLTDQDPPRTPGANGSGNNVLFDVIGRNYKFGLRYKF
jgi:iron complex outermembrane receptor protein